jgi:hypothetical protein
VRVILSDGSGLTARQTATQLAASDHHVEVLSPDPLALTRFTRHVRRVHRVRAYGPDPLGWLDDTVAVLARGGFDVLLPTQEQVAVLSRWPTRVTDLGVALAVPPFDALRQVQDKIAASATLARLGLPQPATTVVTDQRELTRTVTPPVFIKTPIGTATVGVHRVDSSVDLGRLADQLDAARAFDTGGVVAQQPVDGPLAMMQAVYRHGRLIAWHANLREREGVSGGASGKRSIRLPEAAAHLALLGQALGWHGALSADAILTPHGPCYIDLNPRLVEPGNAWRSGVDLVDALLQVSLDRPPAPVPAGTAGVRTHQLLLAVLAAARHGRRAVYQEILAATRHTGTYQDSSEELTPLHRDPLAALPVALATAATLLKPSTWQWFAAGAVNNYALTPAGWQQILRGSDQTAPD